MSGGFGISQSKNKSESWQDDYTPSQYLSLRPVVAEGLADIIKSGGGARFKGPFVAPITAVELEQLQRLMHMQEPTDVETAGEGLLGRTIAGEFLDPESNPFIADYVRAAQSRVTEEYDADERERRALFARAGHQLPESSPFSTAQVEANAQYADALADIATNVYYGGYQFERQAQQQAVEQERINQATMFQEAVANLEAQALPRLIEQLGIDRALEEFYRRQEMLAHALGIAGDLSAPTLGGSSLSEGRQSGWNTQGGYAGKGTFSTE